MSDQLLQLFQPIGDACYRAVRSIIIVVFTPKPASETSEFHS